MSRPYPGSYVSYSPTHNSPPSQGIPMRDNDQSRKRGQVLGSIIQGATPMQTRDNVYMRSPESQTSMNGGMGRSAGGAVQPLSPGHDVPLDRQTSISPSGSGPLMQSPLGYDSNSDRQSSMSSNTVPRKPSAFDKLAQENAQLRQQIEHLRITSEDNQTACDNMLTDHIAMQERLDKTQATLTRKDEEISSLRQQLEVAAAESRGAFPDSLRPGQRNEERELRDLRLKCSRLMKESDRKDELLRQAKSSAAENVMNTGPASPSRELIEARDTADRASRHIQTLEEKVNTYIQQLHDWKVAYDGLRDAHDVLERSNNELSQQAATSAKSQADDEALQQMQANHAAELKDVRKMTDFFKQNSEQLSRKNNSIVEQNRSLQDSLAAKAREVEQQRTMIEALQVQMR